MVVLPFRLNRAELFVGNFSFRGIARLKPGVTIAQANADVARMIPLVSDRFPMAPGFTKQMFQEAHIGPNVRPLAQDVIGDVGRVLWVLLGTVGIVLLIACANVANLFLVRAEGRQQELAIHAALGAGSRRIAWELLSESLLLGVIGGAVGLLLASIGIRSLVAMAPDGLPRVQDIGIDPVVLLFTLAISLLAGALFGAIPVIKFATPRLASALNQGGRLGTASKQRHRVRNALVVIEIALAVVLLVGSGLMIRTFQAMRRVDPGFVNPAQVLTMRVSIPESLIKDPVQTARTFEQIQTRLGQIPGVSSVGITSAVAMDGIGEHDPVFVEDFPGPGGRIPPIRRYKMTDGSYFATMGNHLVAGRALNWDDSFNQLPVVVISENLAREYWKDPRAALGRRIRNTPDNPWRTIVGVVGDERDEGLAKPATPIVYWPLVLKQFWNDPVRVQRGVAYVIRTERPKSTTLDQGDSAGGVGRERQPAGRQRPHPHRHHVGVDGADLLRIDHARDRGRGRASSRRGRHLRRHRVCGRAADEGDRDSHRARRAGARRHHALRAAGTRAGRRRDRDRDGGGRPGDACDVDAPLRRRRAGSASLTRRSRWVSA